MIATRIPSLRRRGFVVSVCLLALSLLLWGILRDVLAQEAAVEQMPLQAEGGTYLSLFWLPFMILCVAVWLYLTAWVCDDAMGVGISYPKWTSIMLGAGAFGLLWMLLVHGAFGFLVLACVGGATVLYIQVRNQAVPEQFKLFSKKHAERMVGKLPFVKDQEAVEKTRLEIHVVNQEQKLLAEFVAARPELSEAAAVVGDLIARASLMRARSIRIEPSAEGYAARFNLDGVAHNVESVPPELGQAILVCVASFAGFESKGKAAGQLVASLPGEDKVVIEARGVKTDSGPAIVLFLPDWTEDLYRGGLAALGMHKAMVDKVMKVAGSSGTALLVSGSPASGLTTTLHAIISQIDIFTTDIVTLEKKTQHELAQVVRREVDLDSHEAFLQVLQAVLREEPHVIAVDGLRRARDWIPLFQFTAQGGRLLGTIKAVSSGQAVQRLLVRADANLVSRGLSTVLNQRLIRRLCEHCKEPIEPPAGLLEKLGIDPARAGTWFRPVGCEQCLSCGYFGRTAIFEMLIVNDDVRRVIAGGKASAEAIKKAAGKQVLRTLYKDGLLKVRQGITTLEEIRRVLR